MRRRGAAVALAMVAVVGSLAGCVEDEEAFGVCGDYEVEPS